MRTTLLTVLAALLVASGCDRSGDAETDAAPPTTNPPARPAPGPWTPSDDRSRASFVGLTCAKPPRWEEYPPQPRRVRNYIVPGRDGSNQAHIAIFHFPDAGGTNEANIQRWRTQFRPDEDGNLLEPAIEELTVDEMAVTIVELQGDHMLSGNSWYTDDQQLIAAIVEAPRGLVFIRFNGDRATVAANRDQFLEMIRALEREDRE